MNLAAQTELSDTHGPHGTRVVRNPPPLPPRPDEIAHLFPQLEILESLGRGGMGVVYKARQKSLDRLVAIKLLAPERVQDPEFAARFQREAQALARLSHPNIVTIHDFGQAGDFYFLLMEYVDGVNLRQLLRARKLSPEEALAIVPPLCEALQYAHERGIVHRDIKPENLLLDRQGRVKIADFGIAKLIAGGIAVPGAGEMSAPVGPEGASPGLQSQSGAGTPGYMAPEQKSAPHLVDSRADIYSLGVVFYEMLTGERPTGPIEPPSRKVQIDVRLDQVVLRALENEPDLRWQSAADLRTQIQSLTGADAVPPRAAAAAAGTRHVLRGVLVGLVVLITGMFAGMWIYGTGAREMTATAVISFLLAVVSGWIYTARSKRSAGQLGTNPPLHATTAPQLGLMLIIASLVIPLGWGSGITMAGRIKLAAERRDQLKREVAAEGALVAAKKQINDLNKQSLEAQSAAKQLAESPSPDEAARVAADERVRKLAAMIATAEDALQAAQRQKERAAVLFHSEIHPNSTMLCFLGLLFALPGTVLGWRPLMAIRGLPAPRPHQASATIAGLTWPLLIAASMVGAIVLLPLNHGAWATLGGVLALLAVIATVGFGIARVLRWLDGRPLLPTSDSLARATMPDWLARSLGALLVLLAVLVPLLWFAAVRIDNSREMQRWHFEMTRLQREWTRATTDRFSAQTALDRHAIAAANLDTPRDRSMAEEERRKLTRALGLAEATVATLDTQMRVMNEISANRRSNWFEQLAPIIIGLLLGFGGWLLLRRGNISRSSLMSGHPIAWLALAAVLIFGFLAFMPLVSGRKSSTMAPDNVRSPGEAGAAATPPPAPGVTVRVAAESDLIAQTERRVLQAHYEKVLNEIINAESERDLLAARTGTSKEVLEQEATVLQQKLRLLSEHRDELRRKLETFQR